MKLRKSFKQYLKNSRQEEDEDDGDDDDDKEKNESPSSENKSKEKLTAILSKAPVSFPWLFPTQSNTKTEKRNEKVPKQSTTTSAFKLFEKDYSIFSKTIESTPSVSGSTFPATNEDTSHSKLPNLPIRNQPINIQLKSQQKKLQQIETDQNQNSKKENKEVNEESVETAQKENAEVGTENCLDIDVPKKALTGGTLLQRATKLSFEDETNKPINNCFPSTSSMLTILEGAKLGIMTEAHREATVSEWRRRSEKELKQKIINNSNVRNVLRSPRQEGEIVDDECSNLADNLNFNREYSKKDEKKTNDKNTVKDDDFDMDISIEDEEFLDIDDDLAKQILADVDKEDEAEAKARKKAKKAIKRLKREKEGKNNAKKRKIIDINNKKPENFIENDSSDENRNAEDKEQKKMKKHKRQKNKEIEKSTKQIEKKKKKNVKNYDDENKEAKIKKKHNKLKTIKHGKTSRRSVTRSYSRSISSRQSFRSKSRSRSRNNSHYRSSSRRSRRSRLRSSASSQTYSSVSPIRRRHSRSRSFSPLPPFNRRRAFENRRRLIQESWHRRIEDSIRPYSQNGKYRIYPIRRPSSRSEKKEKEKESVKADYMDENGEINRQELLEIATRNATKLAMEGKLPKGAELVDTIKNKSVEQLIGLCKQLQAEHDLLPKSSSSSDEENEDRHYSKRYNDWQERQERSNDKDFQNRGVRSAPSRKKVVERERREIRQREDSSLRLNFPVSSGATHRKKANEISTEMSTGPLVRLGEIGPLTTALAKVRTSIPAVYRPLSQPLATSQPTSSLSTNFQSTSTIQLGPQLPEKLPTPPRPSTPPTDIVDSNAYKIALAAAARTAAIEKEKTKEPISVTSSEFIGPVVDTQSKPTPIEVIATTTANALITETSPLSNKKEKINEGDGNEKGKITTASIESVPNFTVLTSNTSIDANNSASKVVTATTSTSAIVQMKTQQVFSSSWDKPGHIAAREEFLRRIAAQKQKDAEAAAANTLQVKQVPATAIIAKESMVNKKEVKEQEHQQMVVEKQSQPNVAIKEVIQKDANALKDDPQMGGKKQSQLNATIDKETAPKKVDELKEDQQMAGDLIDRMQAYVDAQVARQKSESVLHATILSAQLHQRSLQPKDEMLSSFVLNKTQSKDQIGLTETPKSIQELVADRLKYNQRLQKDPNDYEARKALARVEQQMSKWAEDLTLPGEFTGHTGARVLSEKELEPDDPRFHAWAKKDQFRNAPEVSSGVGMRLLQKMGWKPGQGLGKDSAGPIEPLALDVKADRKGFYSEDYERVPKRENVLDPTGKNPISVLMEVCCRQRWPNPDFHCVESGSQNDKRYLWKAVLNGVEYSPSLPSSNKKAGKAQACMVILEALGFTAND